MKTLKSNQGFTLVETVVAIGLFTIIGLGSVLLIGNMFTTSNRVGLVAANTDQARQTVFRFVQEIRKAENANTGDYTIAQASNQEVIFYTNLDGGADVERVRYYLSNNDLYRGVVKPTGTPYSYNLANESSTLLLNDIANQASPLFYYYDGNFTGSEPALTQPINLTQIRYLRMEIMLRNTAGTEADNIITISAGGVVRSLKSNLGE